MRYITGSRMFMLGCAISIFALSTFSPSPNSPFLILSKRARFSSCVLSLKGLFLPGVVTSPR